MVGPGHLEPLIRVVRRLALNVLGIAVIVDAIATSGTHVAELTTGLVMLGLVPVDVLADGFARRRPSGPPQFRRR